MTVATSQAATGIIAPAVHLTSRMISPYQLALTVPMIVRLGDDTARAPTTRRVSTETRCLPQGLGTSPRSSHGLPGAAAANH
jgi:hypothetical protein